MLEQPRLCQDIQAQGTVGVPETGSRKMRSEFLKSSVDSCKYVKHVARYHRVVKNDVKNYVVKTLTKKKWIFSDMVDRKVHMSTAYRNAKKDLFEFGKGSKRVDVCPVETRHDQWLVPKGKDWESKKKFWSLTRILPAELGIQKK